MEVPCRKGSPPWLYLLLFSVGIICHRFLETLVPWSVVGTAACVAATFGFRLLPARAVAVFIAGLAWANLAADRSLNESLSPALENQDVNVTGQIIGVPRVGPRYTRFDFAVDSLEWDGQKWAAPGRIRLRAYHDHHRFRANQAWQLTVRLKRSRSYQNPGSRFNYETYLFQNRLRATGYVREDGTNRLISDAVRGLSIPQFRQNMAEFIRVSMGGRPLSGMLSALVVGVRSHMDDRQWQVLQRTGTIHLVAISGLHIGLVAGVVVLVFTAAWRMTGRLQLWVPAKIAGVTAGLVAGTVYALLAGLTIPTRRALVMLAVVAVAVLLRRTMGAAHLLLLALVAVLIVDPLSTLASGFWLSFAAVAILVWWISRQRSFGAAGESMGPVRRVTGWIRVQVMLALGLAPLLLILFGKVSVAAPLANLVAIPVIGTLVVPPALVALGLAALGFTELALLVFRTALTCLEYLWAFLEWLAAGSWSQWQPVAIPAWLIISAVPGILLLLAPPAVPARMASIIWLAPLLFYRPAGLDHGAFRYTMLEVGHGLASVVETANHVLVYDAGPRFPGGFDAGKNVLLPYLESRGVETIDVVVISHPHNDHAGGLPAIESSMAVSRKLSGAPLSGSGSEPCRSGNGWTWDGVKFEILWPADNGWAGNNASCVVRIVSDYGSLLLTGDIERDVERILVETQGDALASDAIQVPHQGSRTSSSSLFLSRVRPGMALYSTGYLNRYNHPHEEVQIRYLEIGASQWNTAHHGAVIVEFNDPVTVTAWRDQVRGYWFEKPFP